MGPIKTRISNACKEMANLLYSHATGTPPTSAELTDSVNRAISELTALLAPGVNSDTIYYDLFGNLGMFMHLVEQTVLLTAQKHKKPIQAKTLSGALKEVLSSGSGQRIYKSLAEGCKQCEPHDPHDPNQMGGPIPFTASKSDSTHGSQAAHTASALNQPFYPQPFLYTISFANSTNPAIGPATIGPATTIIITDNLDGARLDLSTLRLELITLENCAASGKTALCQFTPPFAAVNPTGMGFPIPSPDPLVPTPHVKVTLKSMGGQIEQVMWTFPDCSLAPGSGGSVSFLIYPRDTVHPATQATIFNEGANISFQGASGTPQSTPTNTWLP